MLDYCVFVVVNLCVLKELELYCRSNVGEFGTLDKESPQFLGRKLAAEYNKLIEWKLGRQEHLDKYVPWRPSYGTLKWIISIL